MSEADTIYHARKVRREALVAALLGATLADVGRRYARTNPDRSAALEFALNDAFVLADAVIAESDRREKDGE